MPLSIIEGKAVVTSKSRTTKTSLREADLVEIKMEIAIARYEQLAPVSHATKGKKHGGGKKPQ